MIQRQAICGICLFISQFGFADTLTWTGATNNNWNNSGNWMSNGSHMVPQSGDSLVFPITASMNNDLTAGLAFPSINVTSTGSVLVTGNSISLNDGSTVTYNQTFGMNVALTVPIVLSGTSTINTVPAMTFGMSLGSSGGISGSGGILKTGAGSLGFSGDNSYSGSTHIAAGEIFSNGSLSNSTLIIDSGAKFTLTGGGPVGAKVVAGLSGAGTVSSQGATAAFTVNQNMSDTTFSGSISPLFSLDFTKTGSSKLTLSGTNPYPGTTTVSAGALQVNETGSLSGTSSVSIAAGAILIADGTINTSATNLAVSGTLQGKGTVGKVTVNNGGIVAPGNQDTLTVSGNYTQTSGTYNASITPGGLSDLIDVSGTASIAGGTLNVIPEAGPYTAGTTYTLLSASSLTGTYTVTLTAGSSGLTPDLLLLSYPNNTVVLTIISPTPPPAPIPTENVTGNNLALANYLNSIPAELVGEAYTILINLPEEELTPALVAINPSRTTAALFTSQNTLFNLSKLVSFRTNSQHLFEATKRITANSAAWHQEKNSDRELIAANDLASFWPTLKKKESPQAEVISSPEYSVWMTGFGYFAEQGAQDGNPKFDTLTGGLVLGVERNYLDLERSYLNECVLGGALSYNRTSLNQDQFLGDGIIDGAYGALYGTTYLNNGLSMDFSFWGNYLRIENTRNVFYPGYSAVSKSAHNSYGGDLHGALGFDFHVAKGRVAVILEPYAAVDWAFQAEEGYTEYGSNAFNMNVEGRFSSMLQLDIGLNNFLSWFYDWGVFTWRGTLSYVNKFPFNTGSLTASVIGAPSSFTMTSFTETQFLFSPSVEFSWKTTRGSSVSLLYDGEFGSGYIANEVALKVGKDF